jgi:CMP-N,N'-diacetyllegionaminic acid synthase
MSVLAVIPARGGSQGIEKKNVKEITGKPLVVWMIGAAKKVGAIDKIALSTNDATLLTEIHGWIDIMDIGFRHGLDVITRPDIISGPLARSEEAVLHALKFFDDVDVVLMLQPTSPLTLPEDIEGVLEALDEPTGSPVVSQFDSAFSVTPFDKFLWADSRNDGNDLHRGFIGINHDYMKPREMRQQRHGQYLENGAVYAMRTEPFLKYEHRFCGFSNTYVMPKERSIEIDDMTDFVMAEALLKEREAVAV